MWVFAKVFWVFLGLSVFFIKNIWQWLSAFRCHAYGSLCILDGLGFNRSYCENSLKWIVTIFSPNSGGLPHDRCILMIIRYNFSGDMCNTKDSGNLIIYMELTYGTEPGDKNGLRIVNGIETSARWNRGVHWKLFKYSDCWIPNDIRKVLRNL